MAGDNRLVTENFLRLNFTPKSGITPGTDNLRSMDCNQINARYNVSISGITSTGLRCPSQNELTAITVAYPPTVVITSLTSSDYQKMNASANVTSDGGSPITQMGFIYDQVPVPNGLEYRTLVTQAVGPYSKEISGLVGNRTYYVRAFATNAYGTSYSDQLTVTTPIPTITIPDIFTPNGDGVHDTFEVYGLHYYTDHNMRIFESEFGDLIYESTNYANSPWNGYYNNVFAEGRVPNGIYYYVLEINGTAYSKSFVRVYYTS